MPRFIILSIILLAAPLQAEEAELPFEEPQGSLTLRQAIAAMRELFLALNRE